MVGACVLLLSAKAFATDYYISAAGSDLSAGTSELQPWQTLERVYKKWRGSSNPDFEPGDRILLRRGDTFSGKLYVAGTGTSQQPIVIGAYGSGNRPIIRADGYGLQWAPVPNHPACYQLDIGDGNGAGAVFHRGQVIPAVAGHDISNVDAYLSTFPPTVAYGPHGGAPGLIYLCNLTDDFGAPIVPDYSDELYVFFTASELAGSYQIMEDLEIDSAYQAVNNEGNARDVTLRRLDVHNILHQGIWFGGGSRNIAVLDSTFATLGSDAVYFAGTRGGHISGNDFTDLSLFVNGCPTGDNDLVTIGLQNTTGIEVDRNYFHDIIGNNLDCTNTDSISVHHNVAYHTDGFATGQGTNFDVHHNVFIAPTGVDANGVSYAIQPQVLGESSTYGGWLFYNNTLYGVSDDYGIRVVNHIDGAPVAAFNNVVHQTFQSGDTLMLMFYNSLKTYSRNNAFFATGPSPALLWKINNVSYSTWHDVHEVAGFEFGSIYGAPQFVAEPPSSTADLRAQSTSPLLEAGVDPKWLGLLPTTAPFIPCSDDCPPGLGSETWGTEGLATDIGAFDGSKGLSNSLADGLLLSSHFDELNMVDSQPSIVDAGGRNYHGIPYGGVSPYAGPLEGAAAFDGADDRIEYGTLGGWNPTTFTASFWMKSEGAGASTQPRVMARKMTLDYFTQTDKLKLNIGATTTNSIATTTTLTEGQWHHIVCTYDDGGDRMARIYVDGALNATGNATVGSMVSQASQALLIGKHSSQPNYFKGQLDELNIWNRVLNPAEIATLFNLGSGTVVHASPNLTILGSNTPNFILTATADYGTVVGATATAPPSGKGAVLDLTGSGWKRILYNYTITTNTHLAFDFRSTSQGTIQGLGLDTDDVQDNIHTLQLFGTSSYGNPNFTRSGMGLSTTFVDEIRNYQLQNGGWKHYDIAVGKIYTGAMSRLFFANEGSGTIPTASFANIRLYEG
jgi:hypothetical protein